MQSRPRSFGVFSFLLRRKQLLTFFPPYLILKENAVNAHSDVMSAAYVRSNTVRQEAGASHEYDPLLLLPPKHRLLNCAQHPDPQLSALPAQEKSILLEGKGNYMPASTSFESSHKIKSSHPRKDSN